MKSYPSHGFIIDVDELKTLHLPSQLATEQEETILDDIREIFLKSDENLIKLIEPEKRNSKKNHKKGNGNETTNKTQIKDRISK